MTMTAKEYLSQAYMLNDEINAKLETLESLKAIATKITAANSGMPGGNGDPHGKEDVIIKIAELNEEIKKDVDRLVDIKRDIIRTINGISNRTHRVLLIKRYVNGEDWENIAVDMGYYIRHIYALHGKALKEIKVSTK